MQKTKHKRKPDTNKRKAQLSAQQTIPYVSMRPDGVCQLPGDIYTKTMAQGLQSTVWHRQLSGRS